MLKLRTVYLYGLDDYQGDECKKEDTHALVGNKFPPLLRKYDRVSCGTIHKNNNSYCPDEFLIKLKHQLSHMFLTFVEYVF